jgi:hypothetical protein
MRAGYTTRMRFYRDTQDATEIVWYRVPDDRPFLDVPTIFASWEWVEQNRPGDRTPGTVGLGEQLTADRIRPARPNVRRTIYRDVYCGTADEWLRGGGLPVAPPVLYDDGFPHCCGPPQVPFPSIYTCTTLYHLMRTLEEQYRSPGLARAYFGANIFAGMNWRHESDNGPTSMPGYLIGTCLDWTVVIISGSTNFQQFALQGMNSLDMPNQFCIDGTAFGTSALYYDTMREIVRNVQLFATPNKPILLIGHSYGGALCNVMKAYLRGGAQIDRIDMATFGAPRAGDSRLRRILEQGTGNFVNVINTDDPVPRLPPRDVPLLLQRLIPIAPWGRWQNWYIPANRAGLRGNGSMFPRPIDFISTGTLAAIVGNIVLGRPVAGFNAHLPSEYSRRLSLNNCGGDPTPGDGPILWLNPDALTIFNDGDPFDTWLGDGDSQTSLFAVPGQPATIHNPTGSFVPSLLVANQNQTWFNINRPGGGMPLGTSYTSFIVFFSGDAVFPETSPGGPSILDRDGTGQAITKFTGHTFVYKDIFNTVTVPLTLFPHTTYLLSVFKTGLHLVIHLSGVGDLINTVFTLDAPTTASGMVNGADFTSSKIAEVAIFPGDAPLGAAGKFQNYLKAKYGVL